MITGPGRVGVPAAGLRVLAGLQITRTASTSTLRRLYSSAGGRMHVPQPHRPPDPPGHPGRQVLATRHPTPFVVIRLVRPSSSRVSRRSLAGTVLNGVGSSSHACSGVRPSSTGVRAKVVDGRGRTGG